MNPKPNIPIQGQPKKPITKNWKSQSHRTGKARKKIEQAVDSLEPLVSQQGIEKVHRAELVLRARSLLCGLKKRPVLRESFLYEVTASVFKHSFIWVPRSSISLADVWQQIIHDLQNSRPDVVQWLNNSESKNAFIWQIAGQVESFRHPFKDRLQGVSFDEKLLWPHEGEIEMRFVLQDGTSIEVPRGWEPEWPLFLVAGYQWQGQSVCDFTVGNMEFKWPCPDAQRCIELTLWEPPMPGVA